jgi:glycopeptide antibiotics resistance protein
MKETFTGLFSDLWPMILICSVVLVVLRVAYLIKNREKIKFYKEIFSFIFIIYIMCLFYVVSFQDIDGQSISGYNIIPFKEMFRYSIGSRLFFKNVVGNLLMFIPFGFFTAYIIRDTKLIWVLIITLIISLTIEITQFYIGRVFDIDDIILNVLGGGIGYYLFSFVYHFKRE